MTNYIATKFLLHDIMRKNLCRHVYKGILLGKYSIVPVNIFQDEAYYHLPVRAVILWADMPAKGRTYRIFDQRFELLPCTIQIFIHTLPPAIIHVSAHLLDKLFTTIYTKFIYFTSSFCMSLFAALFNGYVFIHHPATHRTKSHWSINTAVIEIWASISLYHYILVLSIQQIDLSGAKNFVNPDTYLFLAERRNDGCNIFHTPAQFVELTYIVTACHK